MNSVVNVYFETVLHITTLKLNNNIIYKLMCVRWILQYVSNNYIIQHYYSLNKIYKLHYKNS